MDKNIVIVGIGELGSVFTRGFLRMGLTVSPVVRGMDMAEVAEKNLNPELVLMAVAEKDIDQTLMDLPNTWKDKTGLLQNELLPEQWEKYSIKNPIVISVWFEKKKGMDTKVLLPSVIHGPQANLMAEALKRLNIPTRILDSEQELLVELVVKNVFVYTINIAGLMVGGTTGQLWEKHQQLAADIAAEIVKLQSKLTGTSLSETEMIDRFAQALNSDPEHKCMGRAAQQRLKRAIQLAGENKLELPHIETINEKILSAL